MMLSPKLVNSQKSESTAVTPPSQTSRDDDMISVMASWACAGGTPAASSRTRPTNILSRGRRSNAHRQLLARVGPRFMGLGWRYYALFRFLWKREDSLRERFVS